VLKMVAKHSHDRQRAQKVEVIAVIADHGVNWRLKWKICRVGFEQQIHI